MINFTRVNMHPAAGFFIEYVQNLFKGEAPPKVILEVGSRDLSDSIQFSEAFPESRVIAFEPNPAQYKLCLEKSKNHPNIEVYDYACSDNEELIDFFVVEPNDGASSILEPMYTGSAGIDQWSKISGIRARRLDDILHELGVESVDVIYMDIQGAELRALKGLGRYIDGLKILQAETSLQPYYQGQVLKNDLEDWLHAQGFKTEFLYPWSSAQNFCSESDLLAVKHTRSIFPTWSNKYNISGWQEAVYHHRDRY